MRRFRLWWLVVALSAVLTASGSLSGGTSLWLLSAAAVTITVASCLHSEGIVRSVCHARTLTGPEAPLVHEVVRELAGRTGVPTPRLWLMRGAKPNAFAMGRARNRAVVAVTEPLLADLSPDQARAAVAHELAHIRNRDILVFSIAGAISVIANVAVLRLLFGTHEAKGPTELMAWLVVATITPVGGALLRLAVSRRREYLADATAASLLGAGAPLADALQEIEQGWGGVHASIPPVAARAVKPLAGGRLAELFSTHPSVHERIWRLRAYDAALVGPGRALRAGAPLLRRGRP